MQDILGWAVSREGIRMNTNRHQESTTLVHIYLSKIQRLFQKERLLGRISSSAVSPLWFKQHVLVVIKIKNDDDMSKVMWTNELQLYHILILLHIRMNQTVTILYDCSHSILILLLLLLRWITNHFPLTCGGIYV